MNRKPRVYAAIPTSRDIRDPQTAESFAKKSPTNWVWVAFANRQKKQPLDLERLPV